MRQDSIRRTLYKENEEGVELPYCLEITYWLHPGRKERLEPGTGLPLEPEVPCYAEIISIHCCDSKMPAAHIISNWSQADYQYLNEWLQDYIRNILNSRGTYYE